MNYNRPKRRALRIAAIGSTALALCAYSLGPSPRSVSADGVEVTGGTPLVMSAQAADHSAALSADTATPIKHLVVVFQENSSFDHYFATYPKAVNAPGETPFIARPDTPRAENLANAGLLAPNNPNSVQPFRLAPSQARTCSMNHDYMPEQQAYDGGKMDKFVEFTNKSSSNPKEYCPAGVVMSYYDGNTVTALWNYAQHFAMSDHSFSTTFGPSAPGALNLIAADTSGAVCGDKNVFAAPSACTPSALPSLGPGEHGGTVIGDPDQYFDDWSKGGYGSANTAALVTPNIGERLSASGLTWGWFNGGFATKSSHPHVALDRFLGIDPATDTELRDDYSAHHEPFQYFASTANPHHLAPSSDAAIGTSDPANHQYDLNDFWKAADEGNLPSISFLKAPQYQDGHPSYSDPLDEQEFLVTTLNHLQSLPSWKNTAVVIGWDDSDGWYDHVPSPIVNRSSTSIDTPYCGPGTDGAQARCGYGQRLPYLVISPYARANYVDHTLTDQTSTVKFIEDNWLGGQRLSLQSSFDNKAGSILGMFDFDRGNHQARRLYLDPVTGQTLPADNAFEVRFTSKKPGQGMVYFGSGPNCMGMVQVATRDAGAGTTVHRVLVVGNDLPGTVGNIGITPGTTYWYEAVTSTPRGEEVDNNGGKCYSVSIPAA